MSETSAEAEARLWARVGDLARVLCPDWTDAPGGGGGRATAEGAPPRCGPAEGTAILRFLAGRYPQVRADCEQVLGLVQAGRPEDAAALLERMLAGMPARRSGILWPLATRASWVRILGNLADPQARPAADALVEAYWIPVRELVCRKFKVDRETAEAVASDFFADAVIRNSLAHFDPAAGSRFRDYLAGSLYHFYVRWRDRQRRAPGEPEPAAGEVEAAAAAPEPEPDAELECSLWRWRLSLTLAQAWREIRDGQRAPVMWQVFEAYTFAGTDAPPSQDALAKQFGLTNHQVNNYLHRVRKLVAECVRRIPGAAGEEEDRGARLAPPSGGPGDARFAFEAEESEAASGPLVTVRVYVLDAAGNQNPLAAARGVAVVKTGGVGQVMTPPPHRFRGDVLDGRYVRLAEAVARSAAPGTLELGLRDDLGTGLDCGARMRLVFRAR